MNGTGSLTLMQMNDSHAYLDPMNTLVQRVQELFVQGRRVGADRDYRAAFVTEQAVPSSYGTRREDTGVRAVEALRRYLAKHSPIRADLRGSVSGACVG